MKNPQAKRYYAPGTVWYMLAALLLAVLVVLGAVWWYGAARQDAMGRHEAAVRIAETRELPVSRQQRQLYGVTAAAEALDESGQVAGYTVITERQGYKSTLRVRSTFTADGLLLAGIEVLEQHETEYLGERVATDEFAAGFSGRQLPLKLWTEVTVGSPIDGISGATVSSRAVVEAVNNAHRFVTEGA